MDYWDTLPCVMCKQDIPLKDADYYDYLGKKICTVCYESLSGGNYTKQPPIKEEIQCQVPKIIQLVEHIKETCNAHQKHYKYYCDSCSLSLCLFCLPQHSFHGFSDLGQKAKELVEKLHTIEHCARYSLNYFEDKVGELNEIVQNSLDLYEKVMSRTNSSIVSFLSVELEILFERLKRVNSDLLGLDLDECKKMIENGRDSIKELKLRNYMHWCEWNDRCIHVLDLESMVRVSYPLPNNMVFPLFCRSISLPHKQILVCGGRKESTTPGLNSAFIVHLEENCRVEWIENMKIGRSNHYMLRFKDYIYIIGGCDHLNQFTNKCEKLKISTLKWEPMTSCNQIRDTCSAIGLEDQNCLYVFGGRIKNNEVSATVEKYEIKNDCWVKLAFRIPLMSSVNGVALVSPKKILIFAGQDFESKPMKKSYLLDLEKGKAEETEEMTSKGGCVVNEVAIFRSRVYAFMFQGFTSKSLESWDMSTKMWRIEEFR